MKEKITKGEFFLLGLTAAFLAVLLCLSHQTPTAGVTVDTEIAVPQEAIVPDVSPLDLNTATAEELAELPGIGPELAERILQYRAERGGFSATEELMQVSGIGEGKFAALDGRILAEKGTTE